jgi:alkanesulfonate monooxygenase SsuD/methylene tetrahydromethanopterin reductase-like flavin-dependent oxidoreductase (luciferase family)
MRRLWREDVTSFEGEFARVQSARSFPKPVRTGGVPVIVGGESRAALARAAEYGDGWYGFNLGPDEAGEKIAALRGMLAQRGRDAGGVEVVVAPFSKPVEPADVERYRALGVDELVIVATPPPDEARVAEWVEGLGREWIGRTAG